MVASREWRDGKEDGSGDSAVGCRVGNGGMASYIYIYIQIFACIHYFFMHIYVCVCTNVNRYCTKSPRL